VVTKKAINLDYVFAEEQARFICSAHATPDKITQISNWKIEYLGEKMGMGIIKTDDGLFVEVETSDGPRNISETQVEKVEKGFGQIAPLQKKSVRQYPRFGRNLTATFR